jgi:hypothetical protein
MTGYLSLLFRNWRWVDYFQFVHSIAFVCFGILILIRLGSGSSFPGYLVGGSFLFFGLFRLKYFILQWSRTFLEARKKP